MNNNTFFGATYSTGRENFGQIISIFEVDSDWDGYRFYGYCVPTEKQIEEFFDTKYSTELEDFNEINYGYVKSILSERKTTNKVIKMKKYHFRHNAWFKMMDIKGKKIIKTASDRSTYFYRLALANAYRGLF